MANVEILEERKSFDKNNYVITKTTKTSLTREDLEQDLIKINYAQSKLIKQNNQIKEQYDKLEAKKLEIQETLSQIPSVKIEMINDNK